MNLIEGKGNISILLADDHPLVRRGLRAIIESLNFPSEIVEARDGLEALEFSEEKEFDLFILDIKMPRLDGYELTEILLKRNPTHRILVTTMYSEPVLICSLFCLGVRGFLTKNSDIDEVEASIQSVIAGDLYYNESFREVIQKQLRSESSPKFKFTKREMALITELSKGKTSKEIAATWGLTLKTIEIYRSRILDKAGVKNTSELLSHCHNRGTI